MEITPATPRAGDGARLDGDRAGAGGDGRGGGLFRRRGREGEASTSTPSRSTTTTTATTDPDSPSLVLLLAALAIAVALVLGLHWSALAGAERHRSSTPTATTEPRVVTLSELSTATRPPRIFVAYAGEVFDVGPENKHYGPGGEYSRFAGRDATRAFATGDFEGDSNDDVADLLDDEEALQSFSHWARFYGEHESYERVGVVGGGRFYDEGGGKRKLRSDFERAVDGYRRRESERRSL